MEARSTAFDTALAVSADTGRKVGTSGIGDRLTTSLACGQNSRMVRYIDRRSCVFLDGRNPELVACRIDHPLRHRPPEDLVRRLIVPYLREAEC